MSLSLAHVRKVAEEALPVLSAERAVLEIEAKSATIVGDTHGDLETTERVLDKVERGVIVFLGDYVDRGPYQLENIVRLLEAKVDEPKRIFLLRGNHESREMNMYYGFYDVVSRRLGSGFYGMFGRLYSALPVGAVLSCSTILLHGGVPEGAASITEVASRGKQGEDIEDPVVFQALWNDPREWVEEFMSSPRGVDARVFGRRALERFLEASRCVRLIRAHEPVKNGFEPLFGGKLYTVFSCRFYGIRPAVAEIGAGGVGFSYVDDL
ncbi:MAG: metallophosphoesterase [Nitrososphaerota archaeon]|nr:metallophosphoesterase [Candidatus Calditenuaceae archaeon]MDW8074043.1 metallophosphoesterase [Nitrososphaerota archaeon]